MQNREQMNRLQSEVSEVARRLREGGMFFDAAVVYGLMAAAESVLAEREHAAAVTAVAGNEPAPRSKRGRPRKEEAPPAAPSAELPASVQAVLTAPGSGEVPASVADVQSEGDSFERDVGGGLFG